MHQFRRPIALLLALLIVMVAIPTTILAVFATDTEKAVAKATLITAPIYTEYVTVRVILDNFFLISKKFFTYD